MSVEAWLSKNPINVYSKIGCLWNAAYKCNFDTNAKTLKIPQYSRIIFGDNVITNTGTSAYGGISIDLSAVQHGYIMFDRNDSTFSARPYTDTTFSSNEIVLFVYSNYGENYLAGISDVTVNGVTRLINASVTADKIADNAVTEKKIAKGAITSKSTTVAGRNAYVWNTNKYPEFNTVAKTLNIPQYSRVICGTSVYPNTSTATSGGLTIDLSAVQHGYITFNPDTNEWNIYAYTVTTVSENEIIVFTYSDYGKIVSSQSVYKTDGKLMNIDTDINIPDKHIERNMLAPKVLQNHLGRCPRYTYTDMNVLGHSAWSDISFIDGKLWMFYPSGDETHTATNGVIKIVDKETLETIKTIGHNFGHVNTCDYCAETDCLIVGNLPGNSTYPAALYIFYNVSEWENVDTLDFATVDKTIIDMRVAFSAATNVACSWGESNFAYNNIAYVSMGYDKKFAKIVLGMGTNQLAYGTYATTDDNKFNGTYNVVQISDYDPMVAVDEVIQGATFYAGRMLTANGDEWTGRASLWGFDGNGNIQRELIEFPIYNANGEKNSQYKTYTEGIAVDDDGWIYQGLFSGQLYAIRFYLIKYKL